MPQSNPALNPSYYLFSTHREDITRLCHRSDCVLNDLERLDQEMTMRLQALHILLSALTAIETKVTQVK